jgi:AraC-like DNA-binding protein
LDRRAESGHPRGFVAPARALSPYASFGFLLPSYRRRGGSEIRRVPTARATIYFARDVRAAPGGERFDGVFCEGPRARGFTVGSESGELVAIKVAAGGLRALLGVPARELRDQTVSLGDVWGSSAALLTERMLSAKTPEARYEILQGELIRRCRAFTRHDDSALRVASVVERRRGQVSIADLCRETGLPQRTLLARFDDWVGVTPKQLARASRLRSVLARVEPGAEVRWADIALDCGFYDQAHLVHEFQDLLGLSPDAFLGGRRHFSPLGAPAFGRHAVPLRERALYRNLGMVSDWTAEPSQSTDSAATWLP